MLENSGSITLAALFGASSRKMSGQLLAYFEKLGARLQPLPAYTATIMGRCCIVCAAFWLALQGAYRYSAALMPADWWFAAFMCASAATFVFAARLWRNLPGTSAAMQFASILLIGISLVQGGQLGLFSSRYLWLVPAIALLPAFCLAVRCNLEVFACAGYAVALAMPILAGVSESRPLLFFGYCFLLCLPLPLLALFRRWTYLNLGVFSWLFGAGSYYLVNMRSVEHFYFAQWFFILFLAGYVLTVWARITRSAFNIRSFFEFFFSVGLAVGGVICQLLVALPYPDGVLFSAAALGLSLLAVSITGRLIWGENGVSLSRIYFFIAAALLDGVIALLWPGAVALGIYCLQAAVLFWLGSAAGIMRVKAGGFIILMLAPAYFFAVTQHVLAGSMLIASTALFFSYMQDRELKRLVRRSGKKPWSSRLEFFLVAYGFVWCFGGLAVFTFGNMPSPGLIYFALSSACAYLFFALGKFFRLRSLRTAIFIPMLIAMPAALLPFVYQTCIEWPDFSHMVSYNYLTEFGTLAWVSYFITVWTALYNWGGLISNRAHARFLALVTLELVLVLTSSSRAFALEAGVSPSLLSVLAVLPSLACIFVLARVLKRKTLERSYRKPMLLVVPWLLFVTLALWFVSSLNSPGSAAPGGKYIPLLNPMEAVQLACILLFAYWQHRLRKSTVPMSHLSRGVIIWVYGISSFLWIHGAMFRVVQYFSQATVQEVFGFVELRIIFACIWVSYGILVWIGGALFASTFSWLTGFILLAAGTGALIYLGIGLWGQFVAAVMGSVAIIILILLVWRSPLPFTRRGRKMAEQRY